MFTLINTTKAADGEWFHLPRDGRSYVPVAVTVATTGTVILEGRIEPTDRPVQITSETTSGGFLAAKYPYMRARVTAAGGAVSVSVDSILRPAV